MMENIVLILAFAMGILLCYFGFRLFRISMAMAGFFMGMQVGQMLDSLFLLEKIPADRQEIWEWFFPIAVGVLLALLSYAIYKKALFLISMFFTWYTLVKIFLLYIIKSQTDVKLFITFAPGSIAKLTQDAESSKSLISDSQINAIMNWLPGNSEWEKLLAVCLIALVIGIVVGILICILQEPAIKVITAVIGAGILRDAFVSAMGLLSSWQALPEFLRPLAKEGLENVWVSFFIWAALIGSGITAQIKSKH